MTTTFPGDFLWGTATASYQVEGAIREDGRTPSIWDTFCEHPGTVADGSSGEIACDQYHRYPEDIALMHELGVKAYRLSIAWPRIVPNADGAVNQLGIDHYRRELDALREAGIMPVVTLYHWDLPQYLEDHGGWARRDTALRFADYADAIASGLGDRVGIWTTLNEPWCSAYLGYGSGVHAPGVRDYGKALAAVHHLNLAHGLGVQAIRAHLGGTAKVSSVLNLAVNIAQTDSEADMAAKHRADLIANEVFLGPMLEGRYDPEIFEVTKPYTDWSFVHDGDEELIRQPMQSLGVNYYSTTHVRYRDTAAAVSAAGGVAASVARPVSPAERNPMPAQDIVEALPPAGELTAMGWNQEPQGLTSLLTELGARFPDLDLFVSENGSAWDDEVTADADEPNGMIVHDPRRVAYLEAHVRAVADAIAAGAKVKGYFAWSLLDNFEWALGYSKRFGIIRVDYDTQQRIWKDSALRLRAIVAHNAI
ncbi:glycoside hydrolase family 1 protein [Bifidobacterium sp.]|uniref:glycoside hydrolase family 1 protein n=1 Tax=Bifidobacterium sp. TaxID=41200 RepID=UPI0025BC4A09|nr:family 1 glycosylhydrolase [Bifidobacterium sp.]MCH4209509.1 family 1 glycosylhydrolase [Bifidobacterium sp.]MCI1224793.1 family 1 glycosylhydrolase [Bifidobacterium sp.]